MRWSYFSHCIHNWPVTRGVKTPLNSAVLGLLAMGMMHFGPRLELLGFCPPLGQFNGVQWRWLWHPPPPPPPPTHTHIPWWQLTLHTLIVPAVAVSSHNVIPRVGTMGMQCEYFLTLASETINQGLKASKEMLSLEDTEVYSQQGSTLLQNSLSDQKWRHSSCLQSVCFLQCVKEPPLQHTEQRILSSYSTFFIQQKSFCMLVSMSFNFRRKEEQTSVSEGVIFTWDLSGGFPFRTTNSIKEKRRRRTTWHFSSG